MARAAVDLAAPTDMASPSASAARSVADTAALAESASGTAAMWQRAAVDLAALADVANRGSVTVTRSAFDTCVGSDTATRSDRYGRFASDMLAGLEQAARFTAAFRSASDVTALSESATVVSLYPYAGIVEAQPRSFLAVAQARSFVVEAVVDQTQTNPVTQSQQSYEELTWVFDCTPLLTGMQTPTSPRSILFDRTDRGAPTVALADAPIVVGDQIWQTVRGAQFTDGALQPGHRYRLAVMFTPSGTSATLAMSLGLECDW